MPYANTARRSISRLSRLYDLPCSGDFSPGRGGLLQLLAMSLSPCCASSDGGTRCEGEARTGSPQSAVRLCVQSRLVCSAGGRPAGARVRSPVVRIAGWRETKILKPIDEISLGEITSHRAVTTVNAKVASKVRSPEGRVLNRRAKAAWGSRNLTDAAPSLRRGGSDSTVARTCRATGEALLVPARNRRSRVDRITGSTGKSIEGERVTDGFVVALRRGNARGAKEPCCL